jgi:hypothetical protein
MSQQNFRILPVIKFRPLFMKLPSRDSCEQRIAHRRSSLLCNACSATACGQLPDDCDCPVAAALLSPIWPHPTM